ncbi:MAG: hypothetical protein ABSG68_19165 [Thermoguttaceae bacterium]|jgi:hypothetical protein
MGAFCFPRRSVVRQTLALATVAGLVLLLASAALVRAAESKQTGERDAATSKDQKPPQPPTAPEAGRPDDFGPPGPPPDKGQRRPSRPERRPGQSDDRPPGPPPGFDGQPRQPGPPGPGQPTGPQPRGPRQDWASMEKNDPEMYKLIKAENDLDHRTHEMARDFLQASKDQRPKLKAELKKVVTEQFETRQQRRALELKRLEDELKRLREAAERREKDRQQIIEKRVSELLPEEAEAGF